MPQSEKELRELWYNEELYFKRMECMVVSPKLHQKNSQQFLLGRNWQWIKSFWNSQEFLVYFMEGLGDYHQPWSEGELSGMVNIADEDSLPLPPSIVLQSSFCDWWRLILWLAKEETRWHSMVEGSIIGGKNISQNWFMSNHILPILCLLFHHMLSWSSFLFALHF